MSAAAQLLLLLLQLVLQFSNFSANSYRIGISEQPESLNRLAALNTTELVEKFGSSTFTFVNVDGIVEETDPAVVAYSSDLRAQNLDAIVGSYNRILASVCTLLNLPMYVVDEQYKSPELSFTAYLNDSSVMLVNVIREKKVKVIVEFTRNVAKRQSIIIVTDHGDTLLDSFLDYGSGLRLFLAPVNSTQTSQQIRSVLYSGHRQNAEVPSVLALFVDNIALAKTVLDEAVILSMVEKDSYWLVPELFASDSLLLPYRNSGASIYLIRLTETTISNNTNLIDRLVDDSLLHFVASQNFTPANASAVDKILGTTIDAGVTRIGFDRISRQNKIFYFTLSNPTPSNDAALNEFATYNETVAGNFTFTSAATVTSTLPELILVGMQLDPFVMLSLRGELTGFSVSLINELAAGLFIPRMRIVGSNYLDYVKNGTAHGALNLVQQKPEYIADSRLQLSELPLIYSGIGALGHSAVEEIDFLSPLYPLTWNVWFAIILAFIILSATLYLTDKISPNDYKRPKFTVASAAFFVYSSFVMSKLKSAAIKPSSRIFILILWFASLMYCTSYGTNYFYLLIRREADLRFTSLSELYNQSSSYYWMLERNSEEQIQLSNQSAGSIYRLLLNDARFVNSMSDGMNTVLNSTFAGQKKPIFIGDEVLIEYYAKRSCKLAYIRHADLVNRMYLLFGATVNAELMQSINAKIQLMNDQGNLEEIKDRFWIRAQCSANEKLINSDELKAVTIDKLAGIFIVLAVAFALSFLVLLLEYILYLVALKIQRFRSDPKLKFGHHYNSTVTNISSSGVQAKVHGRIEYIPNELLSPDPERKLTASDMQITYGSVITLVYLGNDPSKGTRIFQRLG